MDRTEKQMEINCTYHPVHFSNVEMSKEFLAHEWQWEHYPKMYYVAPFPLKLDIEVTNRCNKQCSMCAFHSRSALFRFPSWDMPLELFKKIIDEGEKYGLNTLKLNYSGEPLLYPHLCEAINYAKSHGVIDIRFNTNGELLTKELMIKLIKVGLDRILFSDYGNKNVHEKILMFEALKRLSGVSKPIITIQKIVYPDMTEEDKSRWEKYWNSRGDFDLGFQEYFDYNRMPFDERESDFQCAFLWQRILILANGDIYTCCGMPHKKKLVGNARTDSIKEIWDGPVMNEYRELHKNRESHKVLACVCCPMRTKMIGGK